VRASSAPLRAPSQDRWGAPGQDSRCRTAAAAAALQLQRHLLGQRINYFGQQ
jgi:hypothetical protein